MKKFNIYKKKIYSPKTFLVINIFFFLFIINQKKSYYLLSKNPKISVFLPIYNKANYLFRSIGSIQNQTLKNIEIVAINDGSTDNTLGVLKKLAKKDSRIKIINNDRNHGLLYSRAMGIINSTGEYVMNLDPDDKFSDNNSLETLDNKTKKDNLDLIIFLIKRIPSNEREKNLTLKENKFQFLNKDYRITNKLIRRKILLKAYKFFEIKIYGNKWNFHEDNIWNILVRVYAKKTLNLSKFIYIYKRNNESLNLQKGHLLEFKNRISRTKFLIKIIEKYKNNSIIYLYNYYWFYKDIL